MQFTVAYEIKNGPQAKTGEMSVEAADARSAEDQVQDSLEQQYEGCFIVNVHIEGCHRCGKVFAKNSLHQFCPECRLAIKAEQEAKGPFVYTMLQVGGQFQMALWNNATDGTQAVMKSFNETVTTNSYSSCRVYRGPHMYNDKEFDLAECTLLAEWIHA